LAFLRKAVSKSLLQVEVFTRQRGDRIRTNEKGAYALHSCMESALKLDLGGGCQRFYIGYSGGVDSHVLLHCCASIAQLKGRITAVYVHHGLQAEAEFWAKHCEKTAKDLGVEFLALRVNAKAAPGESPEEAARNARYAALKSLMNADDVLLLAQHSDDQLETVLLQLFRGSGLRGLSGMPERQVFGAGFMLRPLLNTSKQVISDYAQAHQLSWVEDPSNQSNDYDRNFLRNAVVPLLKQRWPALDKTVSRSAKHCADAQVLVDEVADELFDAVFNPADKTLRISRLLEHHSHQQQLIIRHWFRHRGLKMPSQAKVGQILTQVVAAAGHRDPELSGQGYSIRRYRDKLYCLTNLSGTDLHLPEGHQAGKPDVINLSGTDLHLPEGHQAGKPGANSHAALQNRVWPVGQTSINITNDQALFYRPSSKGILYEQWQAANVEVRFRQGGEKICLPGREGHHSLKNLFQEAGIPPWERDVMPLIYLNGKLAAVGDKWVSAAFYSEKAQACISFYLQS
jgi:tRNA(Ile)-lysidine synthase